MNFRCTDTKVSVFVNLEVGRLIKKKKKMEKSQFSVCCWSGTLSFIVYKNTRRACSVSEKACNCPVREF